MATKSTGFDKSDTKVTLNIADSLTMSGNAHIGIQQISER